MEKTASTGNPRDEGTTRFTGTSDAGGNAGHAKSGPTDMDKAKELGSAVVDKAKEAASAVAQTIGEAGSALGEKAREATSAVGGGMKSLAGSIRENTSRAGVLGTASSSVAGSLEKGGRYLQEEGLRGMAENVARLIRRNPLPALAIGLGVGFLLARVTTRR